MSGPRRRATESTRSTYVEQIPEKIVERKQWRKQPVERKAAECWEVASPAG